MTNLTPGIGSVWVPVWFVLSTSDHKFSDLNPAGGRIQLMTVQCFIVQSLSLSPFPGLDMT